VTVYLDTSVLLGFVLGEAGGLPLADVRRADALISSELLAVESRRTLDRLRVLGNLSHDEAAERLSITTAWLDAVDLVRLRPPILSRASEPLPTPLGTLDALHLATALVWRDRMNQPLTMATYDAALGQAARAFGFEVLGQSPTSSSTVPS
jgi:predicted nucleic acid-binding protein